MGKDYRERDVVDKLGIKPGHAVAFLSDVERSDATLYERIAQRTGRPSAALDESVDVVLAPVDDSVDVAQLLKEWKARLNPAGGIWLLTRKRGNPGYVNQNELISAGLAAGLVDNKVCSISDHTTAIRFVIRKADRPSRN